MDYLDPMTLGYLEILLFWSLIEAYWLSLGRANHPSRLVQIFRQEPTLGNPKAAECGECCSTIVNNNAASLIFPGGAEPGEAALFSRTSPASCS